MLGVPDIIVDAIMGWEPRRGSNAAPLQHVTGRLLRKMATRSATLLWGSGTTPQAHN